MEQLVSIIIPTYNRAHLIGQTLDSVCAQTYEHWECIVVDDGSSDYTKELLAFYTEKDARIQYHNRPSDRPKGANACRNYGFELSTGKFIQWFDSDDLMVSSYYRDCIIHFEKNKNLDLVLTNYDIFRDSDKVIFHRQRNVITNLSLDYFTGKINFGTPHCVWKKSVVADFVFDTLLTRAQELDFHFKILSSKRITWSCLDHTAVLVRRHVDSITSSYHAGFYKPMQSELKVRRAILKYLYTNKYNLEHLKDALNIYVKGFEKFCKSVSLKRILAELRCLEQINLFTQNYYRWKIELILLIFAYKMWHRTYRLKTHLNKLDRNLA